LSVNYYRNWFIKWTPGRRHERRRQLEQPRRRRRRRHRRRRPLGHRSRCRSHLVMGYLRNPTDISENCAVRHLEPILRSRVTTTPAL
jgi:hypothetical protein